MLSSPNNASYHIHQHCQQYHIHRHRQPTSSSITNTSLHQPTPNTNSEASTTSSMSMNEFKMRSNIHHEWNVTQSNLPPTPTYQLKCGFRQIQSNVTQVIRRIRECLRLRSIHAMYDNDSATARCKNDSFVIFEIRLFAGDTTRSLPPTNDTHDNKSEHEKKQQNMNLDLMRDCVIVHVHRISGCGFSFREECIAILDAAENKPILLPTKPFPYSPPNLVPIDSTSSSMSMDEDGNLLEQVLSNTKHDLLQSKSFHREKKIHALQNLVFMTSPIKSSKHISRITSKRFMESDLRKAIISFLVLGKFHSDGESVVSSASTGIRGRSNMTRSHDNECNEAIRYYCLAVLVNVMNELTSTSTSTIPTSTDDENRNDAPAYEGVTPEIINDNHEINHHPQTEWFNDRIMPSLLNSLISDIHNFKDYPHLAVLAATCLSRFLHHGSGNIRDMMNNRGVESVLDRAQSFAETSHLRLEVAIQALRIQSTDEGQSF